jgi:hypothetical protein
MKGDVVYFLRDANFIFFKYLDEFVLQRVSSLAVRQRNNVLPLRWMMKGVWLLQVSRLIAPVPFRKLGVKPTSSLLKYGMIRAGAMGVCESTVL